MLLMIVADPDSISFGHVYVQCRSFGHQCAYAESISGRPHHVRLHGFSESLTFVDFVFSLAI